MVKYYCDRCGYTHRIKSTFIKHLNRKYICKPKIKDIEISIIYNKYFKNDKKISDPESVPMWYNSGTNDNKCGTNDQKCGTKRGTMWYKTNTGDDTSLACKYCNKIFSDRHGRWKHEKSRCKLKDNKIHDDISSNNNSSMVIRKNKIFDMTKKDDLIESVTEMLKEQYEVELRHKDEQIKELIKKTGISVSINNNNLTSNNSLLANNISNGQALKLNAYDQTDHSHITDEDVLECIRKGNMGIPHFIKLLHFNKDKPENHNVFINNLKSNYLHMYNGERWLQKVQFEEVDMMVQDIINIIEDKIEHWYDTEHVYTRPEFKIILDKFPRLLDRLSVSKYVSKRVERESKLQLFNDRHMPMEYRDQMEKIKRIK
jgi:hypothetical protein